MRTRYGALCLMLSSLLVGRAAEIKVIASNGVKAAVEELAPKFEHDSGNKLSVQWGSTAGLKQKIQSGEAADVIMLTTEAVDQLVTEGKISKGSVIDLGRIGVGIGFRAGMAAPDVRTMDGLKHTLEAAKSVTYAAEGASRVFVEAAFEKLGIAAAMKPKVQLSTGSGESTSWVASGKADLVLTLVSEILPAKGVSLAGPFPREVQNYVSFRGGTSAKPANKAGADALLGFLKSSQAKAMFKAKGME